MAAIEGALQGRRAVFAGLDLAAGAIEARGDEGADGGLVIYYQHSSFSCSRLVHRNRILAVVFVRRLSGGIRNPAALTRPAAVWPGASASLSWLCGGPRRVDLFVLGRLPGGATVGRHDWPGRVCRAVVDAVAVGRVDSPVQQAQAERVEVFAIFTAQADQALQPAEEDSFNLTLLRTRRRRRATPASYPALLRGNSGLARAKQSLDCATRQAGGVLKLGGD